MSVVSAGGLVTQPGFGAPVQGCARGDGSLGSPRDGAGELLRGPTGGNWPPWGRSVPILCLEDAEFLGAWWG